MKLVEQLTAQGDLIQLPRSKYFNRNREQSRGNYYPCAICGKNVKSPKYGVHMFWGDVAVTDAGAAAIIENEGHGGDMGFYPVGSDCLRNNPQIKPFLIEEES